ncbi:hypothetical protein HPB50_006346 [Hyalomma asiaticum]|uniref:Uncharacterized protein n=1 Tax=Hyalomma asiaticum TaxID=266040 RepID=A0ACB7S0R7_HYAAI|nr:hypothetical protein HPB50_006346 [Hyalomma asiaticum]
MQNKTRATKGPGHSKSPSSPKNKRPSPERQHDGRHKTRRRRDNRQLSADPCTDFYEHACGRWAPLDPEAVAKNYTDEMYWNYTNSLFRLLERGDNDTLRGPGRSISNFYSSCVRFFTSPNKTTFYSDSVNILNISEHFWRNMTDWSNATFGLTASDAVEFVARYVGNEIEDFKNSLLTLDATMEGHRASFDRQASFYAPRSKNESFVMQVLYDLAMHHASHMTRMVVKGTLLVRGVNEINQMLFTMGQSPPNLVAVYCYMIAASDMLAYAIIRERHGDVSRGQASLGCVYTLLRQYHSGFLHWAAKFLQTRYTVDAARRITTTILNEFVDIAPANVLDDVRTMRNCTEFHFYGTHAVYTRTGADPSSEVYSKPAKVNPPYVPDDFLRNLVIYAQSPSDDSVLWTPFQETQRLDQTTRLVHDKRLHVVVPPVFLTEDFFHADAFQDSMNLATLGVYVADVFLNAVDDFGTEKVRLWKRKVQDCHRANAKLLGWDGAAEGAEDLDYDIVSRLSVAYVAAFGNEEAYGERSQFFFRRFALAYCASNASVALRTSIQCAVRHLPPFETAFGCKPSGFTRCRM